MFPSRPPPNHLLAACAVLLASLAVAIVHSAPAAASATCASSNHCYAVVVQGPIPDPHYFTGVDTQIHTQCLSVANPGTSFVTAEVWMVTHETHPRWIEAGQAYGTPLGARKYFFRAVYRYAANGHLTYTEHDDTVHHPNDSTAYETYIVGILGSTYAIESGPFYGTSSGWGATFQSVQTGSEIAPGATASVYASSRQLAYYERSGARHNTWWFGGSAPRMQSVPTAWGYEQAVTPASYYRYGTVTGCPTSSSLTARPRVASTAPEQFRAFARSQSARGSTPSVQVPPVAVARVFEPATIRLVAHGNFVGRAAKIPPGVARPTGTVLTEVVRTDTGEVTSWSLR